MYLNAEIVYEYTIDLNFKLKVRELNVSKITDLSNHFGFGKGNYVVELEDRVEEYHNYDEDEYLIFYYEVNNLDVDIRKGKIGLLSFDKLDLEDILSEYKEEIISRAESSIKYNSDKIKEIKIEMIHSSLILSNLEDKEV